MNTLILVFIVAILFLLPSIVTSFWSLLKIFFHLINCKIKRKPYEGIGIMSAIKSKCQSIKTAIVRKIDFIVDCYRSVKGVKSFVIQSTESNKKGEFLAYSFILMLSGSIAMEFINIIFSFDLFGFIFSYFGGVA